MTIGTNIWRLIKELVGNVCFVLAKNRRENHAVIGESKLYVHDALFFVRKIFVCNPDKSVVLNCSTILRRIDAHIFGILTNTDIQTYVFCLDECVVPQGMKEQVGRMEKAHTAKGRAKRSANQTPLSPLPEGRARYFEDDLPVLGDMNAIFSNRRARLELYAYITAHFCSDEFRACISEGKRVIISGGLGDDLEPILPISASKDDVELISDMPIGRMAEGDLDVLRWVFRFSGDVVVESGDGDVLLYTLLQSRNIFRLDPKRRVFFRTERSSGVPDIVSQLPPKQVLEEIFDESVSSSSSSSKKRKHDSSLEDAQAKRQYQQKRDVQEEVGKKVHQYVNIGKMRKLIINSAVAGVHAPIEELVLAIIIATSEHDFFYRKSLIYYVNEEDVFLAYLKWQHKIGPMVSVFQYERDDPSLPHHHLYRIDRNAVDKFVEFCYYTSLVKQMVKKGKLGEGDLQLTEPISSIMKSARENRIKVMERKVFLTGLKKDCGEDVTNLSPKDRFAAGCAQLAWVLQYGGNAPINGVKLVRGSKRDKQTGKLLYGYTSNGFCLDIANPSSDYFECG